MVVIEILCLLENDKMGLEAISVDKPEQIPDALNAAINADRPVIFEAAT